MYISYDRKNGVEYGKICCSHWIDGKDRKTYINLGRVIDKDNHIFKTERKVYSDTIPKTTFTPVLMKTVFHRLLLLKADSLSLISEMSGF